MRHNAVVPRLVRGIQRGCFVVGLLTTTAHAESELNLAKTFQNPLGINPEARYYTLPFVNYTNMDYGTNKNTQDMLDLKPVMPLPLTSSLDLIVRTIIPLTHQASTHGYINGLGDINPTLFIAPSMNNWFTWGVGPTVVMPTATNKALGAGKWSIGPELVLIAMPNQWTFALLTNNIWSIAGDANRSTVNELTFQYFITYNFPRGWYVTTQPQLTSMWFNKPGEKWTVPFGGGVGRSFQIDKQKLNFLAQYYYNTIRPSTGAHWTIQLTLEFLFPDNRTHY